MGTIYMGQTSPKLRLGVTSNSRKGLSPDDDNEWLMNVLGFMSESGGQRGALVT
jgi:hypothetical protein